MKSSGTKIDVGSVLGAGRELDLHERVPLPEFGSFAFENPADVVLTLRRLGRWLEIEGELDVQASGACARCLDEVRLPLHLEVEERIEPETERADPLGESNVLVDEELDLSDLVRQLIDSALPLVLLCAENCPGLCPTCGRKRDGSCLCPQLME